MDGLNDAEAGPLALGEAWVTALTDRDFGRLAGLCHPDVRSRLMTPKRFISLENAADMTQKVEGWFHDCDSIHSELVRVAMVGDKLSIFYRLGVDEKGESSTIEQHVYCALREGRIDQLSLLCSGFQPAALLGNTPADQVETGGAQSIQADALLNVDTRGGQGSTCAILTPSIKRKLGELDSGQVLEVHVDDPTAQGDIEAWCRLSGNALLKMDRGAGQELLFYLKKK